MDKYIARENLKAELAFMRELFFENLPLGEKKGQIEDYFNCLEKAIDTKDPDEFEREQFPPDDPASSGDRVYKYHSAAQFKQHASQCQVQRLEHGPGLGDSQKPQAELPAAQGPPAEDGHLERLQERPGGHDDRGQGDGRGFNPCPDIQGQLDA
jgi:hypothetical protein